MKNTLITTVLLTTLLFSCTLRKSQIYKSYNRENVSKVLKNKTFPDGVVTYNKYYLKYSDGRDFYLKTPSNFDILEFESKKDLKKLIILDTLVTDIPESEIDFY